MPTLKTTSRLVLIGMLALGTCGLAGVIARRAYRRASAPFQPRRTQIARPVDPPRELRDVTFIADADGGAMIRGWYTESRNGAAVVVLHGSGTDRTGALDEALFLAREGFGVLMFDWPGHGESDGSVSYGSPERAALTAAIGWVAQQPEVRAGSIGVYGFSIGGYLAAQVAPTDPRVAALALAGTPTTLGEVLDWQYRKFGVLSRWPARYAFERHGADLTFDVRTALKGYSGRPLLIISAEADGVVPVAHARELFRNAGQPKQLFVSTRAHHGQYVASDAECAQALGGFFRLHLLESRGHIASAD